MTSGRSFSGRRLSQRIENFMDVARTMPIALQSTTSCEQEGRPVAAIELFGMLGEIRES